MRWSFSFSLDVSSFDLVICDKRVFRSWVSSDDLITSFWVSIVWEENCFESVMKAVEARATLGEIIDAIRRAIDFKRPGM